MVKTAPQFPIVDALLMTPPEGQHGLIGICTNTSAPGQVFNEIEEHNRNSVSVLGPLIVSRDGTERMILNSLSHPTIQFLILFSEESLTFSPSTNLLQALQHGIDTEKDGNYIVGGCAASAHFPNLSKTILDTFRDSIVVLPLFMHKNEKSQKIVEEYLAWVQPRIPADVHKLLVAANTKEKIYYDVLNELIAALAALPQKNKEPVELDPKEFQHLQPPKVELGHTETQFSVPFCVRIEDKQLRLDIQVGDETYVIRGKDDFLIEYSLMRFLAGKKKLLSPLEQLLIGAELNRLNTEMLNGVSAEPFVEKREIEGAQEILLESKIDMEPDTSYYYKIAVKDDTVSVMCMAFDVCEEVFELRSKGFSEIIQWLAEKNRFEDYEMDILHRMDVGGQIGRAVIAARSGYSFIQDFASIFKVNTIQLPLLTAEGDNFLDVHRNLLLKIYTKGLTEEHGDTQKGLARTAVMLAVYRDAQEALKKMSLIYKQGEHTTEEMRTDYKQQLLRFDHDGDYSYGERTRTFFGFDQLPETVSLLQKNKNRATIIQRFDPSVDMGSVTEPETGHTKYTHDPCLTHDIFFVANKKLHSFHIARAHNTANAYPENIYGLYDAYVSHIRDELQIEGGDMFMLSSRANILLLTEEQRVRKIIAEPSKPMDTVDSTSGPYLLGENIKPSQHAGVAYAHAALVHTTKRPKSIFLDRIENYSGVNTLSRAIDYLAQKGVMHNNPVLTTHKAGVHDAQDTHLAFFQANVFGGKVHATAVFTNKSPDSDADAALIGYMATQYAEKLSIPLGDASVFYITGDHE